MTLADLEHRLHQHPTSPLFARLAKEYLNAGRVEEAKELCKQGLSAYPSYATAHLILAQCHQNERNTSQALDSLKAAGMRLPDSPYLISLYNEWRNEVSVSAPGESSAPDVPELQPKEEATISTEVEANLADADYEASLKAASPGEDVPSPESLGIETTEQIQDLRDSPLSFDETVAPVPKLTDSPFDLQAEPATIQAADASEPPATAESEPPAPAGVVAEGAEFPDQIPLESQYPDTYEGDELSARPGAEAVGTDSPPELPIVTAEPDLSPQEAPPQQEKYEGRIVTRTLAEIYASQGAYAEAILTYQLLKTLRPEESEDYEKRIQELQPKLQERSAS